MSESAAKPTGASSNERCGRTEALLVVKDLEVRFMLRASSRRRAEELVRAVDAVSLQVQHGETLGLVGESGCGKTTLGRAIMLLQPIDHGSVVFENNNWTALDKKALRQVRHRMQMVFQNPYASLNPRMTIFDTLSEPVCHHLKISRRQAREPVTHLMQQVGLDPLWTGKFPHEFSGGQRQRIAIARALALHPALIIADEPVSSLDVSVQAQILNLLMELRKSMNLAMIFVSHDFSVVRHISQRIAVMYRGKIVEIGARDTIFNEPRHPYTRTLLDAVPVPDPDVVPVMPAEAAGCEPEKAGYEMQGCSFRWRCLHVIDECRLRVPLLEPVGCGAGHDVACIRKDENLNG